MRGGVRQLTETPECKGETVRGGARQLTDQKILCTRCDGSGA